MAEKKPDESETPMVRPLKGVNISSKSKSSATVRVRLIQQSRAINPKRLEKAREIARQLKETRDIIYTSGEPSKAAALQKVMAKFAYKKKSLSLFPVK